MQIKAEVMIRKKALSDLSFPFENIIKEFLSEPTSIPNISLKWHQPNVIKFVKQIGPLLLWPELYCFQKFFPLLTRWQLRYPQLMKDKSLISFVMPQEIKKMRTLKGVSSLEVYWNDECNFFKGLIPDVQLKEFSTNKENCHTKLWTTVEPLTLMEQAHSDLVQQFLFSKNKYQKTKSKSKKQATLLKDNNKELTKPLNDLRNVIDSAANDIANHVNTKRTEKNVASKGLQMIDKFFHKNHTKYVNTTVLCSSPILKNAPFELEDYENENILDLSDVVKVITKKNTVATDFTNFKGKPLNYELMFSGSKDDLDIFKKQAQDDQSSSSRTASKMTATKPFDQNTSYFFNSSGIDDEFEKVMSINFSKCDEISDDE